MLTEEQKQEAVRQMIRHCEILIDSDNYEFVSSREVLYRLGYDEEQALEIIGYIAGKGFDYCLDPTIAATHFDPNNKNAVNGMVTDNPSWQACNWGADQLKSRLRCAI